MCVLIPIAIILHNCAIAWFLQVEKLVITMFDLQCWKHKARIYIVPAGMAFHVDQVVIALGAVFDLQCWKHKAWIYIVPAWLFMLTKL